MYDFERPTKLELLGFVHPNYRKQHIGTTLFTNRNARNTIKRADEALLIMNGESASGKEFAKHMKLPYLYSEYSMGSKQQKCKNHQRILYSSLLHLQNHFLILLIFQSSL